MELNTRLCRKCKLEKPITNFKNYSYDKNKRGRTCKRCIYKKSIKPYTPKTSALTGEQKIANQRDIYYKYVYGISLQDYTKLLKTQNGVCKICNSSETSTQKNGTLKNLAVDHCHVTGEIRGLLCDGCNRGLGYFKDNIKSLKNAIKYLKKKK